MIESVNMWQRKNDQRWSVCITVRKGPSKKLHNATLTTCERVQFTSKQTLEKGMEEVLEFLTSMKLQLKINKAVCVPD